MFNMVHLNSADHNLEDEFDPIDNNSSPIPRGNSRFAIESSSHGGSWVDSFVNQTGIDWANSDNINASDGEIKIIQGPPKVLEVDTNTMGLWHFDEGVGSTAFDETSNNNDGSISGATWTTGIFDQSLNYVSGNNVQVPTDPSLNFAAGESFSIEAWIKTDAYYQNIIIKHDSGPQYYHLGIWEEGSIGFVVRCSNNILSQVHGSHVSDNKWHYVVAVRDTIKGQILIYVDGELRNYCADGTTGTISPSEQLRFGKYFDSSALPYNGKIDEIRISDRPLTAWEIAKNYGLYKSMANITSAPITIPANMRWDTLSLNKNEPDGTWVNVSVLNASTNQPIPGFTNLQSSELDLSALDPDQYPTIKLNATFETNQMLTPTLNYWGVSWVAKNTWQDTFFTDLKVKSNTNLEFYDGNASVLKLQPDEYTAGLWFFDEGSGTITNDETEYENNAELNFGPLWAPGKFGNAVDFDGINDYVDFYDRLTLGITGNITIEAWLKFTAVPTTNQYFPIIKKRVIGSDTYQLCIQDDGKARFRVDTGPTTGNVVVSNTALNDGTWHYLAGTWNRTELNIYVDGESDAAPVALTGSMKDTTDRVLAGYHYGDIGSVFDYYEGLMDTIRISNISRSAKDISNIYKNLTGPGITFKNAELVSNPITIANKMYWDTLIINKDEPAQTYLNLTVLDAVSNQPLLTLNNFVQSNHDISTIDPHDHPSIRLQALFETNSATTPVLNDWSVNWTRNKLPRVVDINPKSAMVYRTDTIQLFIDVKDTEDLDSDLEVNISYTSVLETDWQTNFVSDLKFENNQWQFNFTPNANAKIGFYSLNVSCVDTFNDSVYNIYEGIVLVLNNQPTQPDVLIMPVIPKTGDDLTAIASNVTDIEDEPINYTYEWFKNDIPQPGLTTDTILSSYTTQNDVWRCEVTPNDGIEDGPSGETEVEIMNSAPDINNSVLMLTFDEDTIDRSIDLSYVFKDNDNDELLFTCTGNEELTVNIFENGSVELIPDSDWFGTETLTFFANDTFEEASDEIVVRVMPTNDDPVLTKVVDPKNEYYPSAEIKLSAVEDEWLNFTVDAYDIDGDVLSYNTNRTDNIGDNDMTNFEVTENMISFMPTNADVGSVLLNLSVSDNNGSKIYQLIKINVENVNDPPWVEITLPTDGSEFASTDTINFSCEYSDEDLNIPDTSEHLTFKWYTNQSGGLLIGSGESLLNITLEPGFHQITLDVVDSGNLPTTDSINITVTEVVTDKDEDKDTKKTVEENLLWLWLVLIIIIILVIIIVFMFYKRKKQKEAEAEAAAASSDVLTPEVVPPKLTPSGVPQPSVPVLQPSPELAPSVPSTPSIQPVPTQPSAGLGGPQPETTVPRLPPADEPEPEPEPPLEPEVPPPEDAPQSQVSAPAPIPQMKVPNVVQPQVIQPEETGQFEPPEEEPSLQQPAEEPEGDNIEEQPAPTMVSVPCPQCSSPSTTTFPDGSSSCSVCGHKWL
jgi:hypothetical protein